MSSSPTEASSERFQTAQPVLDYESVLAWIQESAETPAGQRCLAATKPWDGRAQVEARRRRGKEAKAACKAQQEPPAVRCRDLQAMIQAAGKRVLDGLELVAVGDVLECFASLRAWARRHPQYRSLSECAAAIPDFEELRSGLRNTVDSRGKVLDEADPELARLRRERRKQESLRERRLEELADRWHKRGLLRQRRPVHRGERLLLAVRSTHQGRAQGVVHDRSQSGDTVFMEPGPLVALSNAIADCRLREQQKVHEILRIWSQALWGRREDLFTGESRLGELDAAVATARWSQAVDAVYPEIEDRENAGFEIRQGRHPLLQKQLGREQVVPLTLHLGQAFELLVVTGPNTGGKTVVLKTVGLLALMACAGLPISAEEGSAFSWLDGVEADIGDAQSLENNLSTFSGHLHNILGILDRLTPGTLVLLDELGTGTDPEEGAALGQAVLETLQSRGALVLATTHLGALKLYSTQVARAENASMEFDPRSLAPKFRLLVGVPGASHALEVAERMGLESEILAKARSLSRSDQRTESLLADISRVRREAEIMRERARQDEAEVRETARRIEASKDQAEAERLLRRHEAEAAYRQLQAELEQVFQQEGQRLAGRLAPRERQDLLALLEDARRRLQGHELGRRWQAFLSGIRKNDWVYVPKYKEKLKVLKFDKKRQRVKLRHGHMELELSVHEISWLQPPSADV